MVQLKPDAPPVRYVSTRPYELGDLSGESSENWNGELTNTTCEISWFLHDSLKQIESGTR